MKLGDWGFCKEEVIICTNITSGVEKLIVWQKSLATYREGDAVYIELNTRSTDMIGNGEGVAVGVQGGVTNGVANVLWNKILRRVKTKMGKNTVVKNST